MNKILLKYHNLKMFMTLDCNTLMYVLLRIYGENITVEFQPMDENERHSTIETIDGLDLVRERFWLFECGDNAISTRRKDLELRIVEEGMK